jgi:hypothetical protein
VEYLRVTFNRHEPTPRDVIANGAVIGPVNMLLVVPANFYEIKLSGAAHTPPLWSGDVSGTLPTQPLVIAFT